MGYPQSGSFCPQYDVLPGDAQHSLILVASTLISLVATADLFDASLICHAIVAKLSEHTPTCSWRNGTIDSNTSHPSNSAAISKSEFVMVPLGFSYVTSSSFTYLGHS